MSTAFDESVRPPLCEDERRRRADVGNPPVARSRPLSPAARSASTRAAAAGNASLRSSVSAIVLSASSYENARITDSRLRSALGQ